MNLSKNILNNLATTIAEIDSHRERIPQSSSSQYHEFRSNKELQHSQSKEIKYIINLIWENFFVIKLSDGRLKMNGEKINIFTSVLIIFHKQLKLKI